MLKIKWIVAKYHDFFDAHLGIYLVNQQFMHFKQTNKQIKIALFM